MLAAVSGWGGENAYPENWGGILSGSVPLVKRKDPVRRLSRSSYTTVYSIGGPSISRYSVFKYSIICSRSSFVSLRADHAVAFGAVVEFMPSVGVSG